MISLMAHLRPASALVGLAIVASLAIGAEGVEAELIEQLERLLQALDNNDRVLRRGAISVIGEFGSGTDSM
jgi:HEAT repeat protein